MQYEKQWRWTMTALVALLLAWNGWQEWSIHQVPERVEAAADQMRVEADRIERAHEDMLRTAQKLESLTRRLEQINVSVTIEGGEATAIVGRPPDSIDIQALASEALIRIQEERYGETERNVRGAAVFYPGGSGRDSVGDGRGGGVP